MSTITTIQSTDAISASRSTINTNFSNLNTDKAELSGATFTGDISVPDEAYGAGWNGSLEVPTKNAIYDKIETMGGGGATTFLGLTDTPSSYSGQALKIVQVNSGETALQFVPLSGGGDALTANPLSQFASTTSAQLAGVISDETGSGSLVFGTSPTLTTPRFADLGYIADSNGNEMLAFNSNASAVNYLELENGSTTNPPHLRSKGDDANIGMNLVGKGSGLVSVCDSTDETKRIRFQASGNSTGVVTTIASSDTTAHTITLPNATDTLVGRATTDTLTNKRITDRIKQDANHTTSVTMDSDSYDEYDITAQAGALLFNNPSGTPTNCQKLMVRIKDNGTARALTYGSQFASGAATLPTTTTLSKKLWIGFEWDSTDSKWYCLATGVQP